MERINTLVLLAAHHHNGKCQGGGYSLPTSAPVTFFLFDRLYALKPKGPV